MITKQDIQENPSAYPVHVKVEGEETIGHILGVKLDFPIICCDSLMGKPSFEFSWKTILLHLNNYDHKCLIA